MNARNILAVVALILALLFGWTWYKNMNLNNTIGNIEAKNKDLATKVGDLEVLKSDLEAEVDSLESAYNNLTEENATLASSLKSEKARNRRKNATIAELEAAQGASTSQNNSLQAQISSLLAAKQALQGEINSLQTENSSLREKLGMAEANLDKAQDDNAALDALNKAMQTEIAGLTLQNFKATAFQVEVEKKRGEKVTAKSRLAKRIKASFDLTGVPEKYQGVRPLYMVITDETSNPIYLDNPIKATVNVNGADSQIIAAEKKELNIKPSQRLSFNHKLGKRLKKGYYRVLVYTDLGVLGASTIRLR